MKIEYTDSFTNDLRETFEWLAENAPHRAESFVWDVRIFARHLLRLAQVSETADLGWANTFARITPQVSIERFTIAPTAGLRPYSFCA